MSKSVGGDSVATVYQTGNSSRGLLRQYTATPHHTIGDMDTYHAYEEITSVTGSVYEDVTPRATSQDVYQQPAPAKNRQPHAHQKPTAAPSARKPVPVVTRKTKAPKHAKVPSRQAAKTYQIGQQPIGSKRSQVPSVMQGNQTYQGGSVLKIPSHIYPDIPTSTPTRLTAGTKQAAAQYADYRQGQMPADSKKKAKPVGQHKSRSAQPSPVRKAGSVSSLAAYAAPPPVNEPPPAYSLYESSIPPPAYFPQKPASSTALQNKKRLICCCILIPLLIVAGVVLAIVFTAITGRQVDPAAIVDTGNPDAAVNPDNGQPDLGGNPVDPPPPDQEYPYPRQFVCENDIFDIRCGKNERIHINAAMYGRRHPSPCNTIQSDNTNCVSSSSLWVVQQHCEGKKECHVLAQNDLFGDPCEGTSKYLTIDFVCEWNDPPSTSDEEDEEHPDHFVCEDDVLHIQCGEHERIHIFDAMFGRRQPNSPCGYVDSEEFTECVSPRSLMVVRDHCEGTQECEIHADRNLFGNYCEGYPNYLTVDFKCEWRDEPPPPPDEELPDHFVCEDDVFHIECGEHERIHIFDAMFGRRQQNSHCGYVTSDEFTECVSPRSLMVVRDHCEGMQECEIHADRNLFGDVCEGRPNYLTVDFKCEWIDDPPASPPDVEFPKCQPIYFVSAPPDDVESFIMAVDANSMVVVFKRMETRVCHIKRLDIWDDAFRPSHWTQFDLYVDEVINYFIDVTENCHEDEEIIDLRQIATVVGDCAVDLCSDVPAFWFVPDEHNPSIDSTWGTWNSIYPSIIEDSMDSNWISTDWASWRSRDPGRHGDRPPPDGRHGDRPPPDGHGGDHGDRPPHDGHGGDRPPPDDRW